MDVYVGLTDLVSWRGVTHYFVGMSGYNLGYVGMPFDDLRIPREEHLVSVEELVDDIHDKRGVIGGVLVGGGEPLLQRFGLRELLRRVRDLDLPVGIVSNLSRPVALRDVLGLVDYVVFDYVAPLDEEFDRVARATTFFRPARVVVEDIRKSLEILFSSQKELFFRTRIIPGLLYRREQLVRMASVVNAPWIIHGFNSPRLSGINQPSKIFLFSLRDELESITSREVIVTDPLPF